MTPDINHDSTIPSCDTSFPPYMSDSKWDINFLPFSRHSSPLLSSHRHFLSLDSLPHQIGGYTRGPLHPSSSNHFLFFNLLSSLKPDNVPAFVLKITQHLATSSDIKFSFHIPYRPQSSDKVGHARVLYKQYFPKLILQFSCPVLPVALLHLRALSRKRLNFSLSDLSIAGLSLYTLSLASHPSQMQSDPIDRPLPSSNTYQQPHPIHFTSCYSFGCY